jgi:hypothetical protein
VIQASILALRKDPRLEKIPPYLSAFCIVVGVLWLLILPLDEYSRRTYVSENALLPGQVHTYFTGSEHNVFRAYRHEVHELIGKPIEEYSIPKPNHPLNPMLTPPGAPQPSPPSSSVRTSKSHPNHTTTPSPTTPTPPPTSTPSCKAPAPTQPKPSS